MNDDLIVINSYPNTVERETILDTCIKQLKKTNKEILLVTHYPVNRKIQQSVDYFIYDKRNHIIDESALYWYRNDNFYLQTGAFGFGSASYAVLLSIQNAFCFAKHLGKKTFYYFEYDYIIDNEDLKSIDLLKNELDEKGKKGYVRIKTHGGDFRLEAICTTFFVLDVDFYFENFKMMRTHEEYVEASSGGVALEFYFYKFLSENLKHLDVDYNDLRFKKDFFPNSRFNLSSYEKGHFIDILPEHKSKKSVLIITNPKNSLREYKIIFLKNDNSRSEDVVPIHSNGYYFNVLHKTVENIQVFHKENDEWKLVYDKDPNIEVNNKRKYEYVRINNE